MIRVILSEFCIAVDVRCHDIHDHDARESKRRVSGVEDVEKQSGQVNYNGCAANLVNELIP